MGFPFPYQLDQSISVLRVAGWYFSNSNRTFCKHSAVSDLDLHCLPMSHEKEARLKWVKIWQQAPKKPII